MYTGNGLSLGRISGIQVIVDWSLLIIFLLITFSLAAGVFPAWHPDWSAPLAWTTALVAAVLFFASVLVHELSHALVGRAGGVEVRRITLFIFGGMAQMENEPPSWRSEFTMAIVGPLTSLALGYGFILLAEYIAGPIRIDPGDPLRAYAGLGPMATLLMWLGPVNIVLGVFNLVPGFPLDGGRVLRAILWGLTGSLLRATRWASRMGQVFAWLLMGTGVLMMLGVRVPFFGAGLVGGLWLAFIGWFLNNAAVVSYRQLLVRESLEDVPVSRIMLTQFTRLKPGTALRTLVDDYLIQSGQRAFPVEENGHFLGMVCLRDVQKSGPDTWDSVAVEQVMKPARDLVSVTPDRDATEVLAILGRRNLNQLPVLEDGRLVGIVRREDIMKWLSVHAEPSWEGRHGEAVSAHH
jgi:Zn-dependent protease/CBS domain-containing protein